MTGEETAVPDGEHMLLSRHSAPTGGIHRRRVGRVALYTFSVCLLLSFPYLLLFVPAVNPLPLGMMEPKELSASPMGIATPVIISEPLDPTYAETGVPELFDAAIQDDIDTVSLNVTWEWGDGTFTNGTALPAWEGFFPISESHTYNPPPEQGWGGGDANVTYIMNLTVSDGESPPVTAPTTVYVLLPPNGYPGIVYLNSSVPSADETEVVTIIAAASDPEGEPLTWTLMFNNSIEIYRVNVTNTPASAPGEVVWNNITHVFGSGGIHTVSLTVSDALPPHQIRPHNTSQDIKVAVTSNQMPFSTDVIGVNPPSPMIESGMSYILVNYSVQAFDNDGDAITVTWDFGDGSPMETNVSAGGTGKYTFVQQRRYNDTGVFNVSAVVTDGRPGHEKSLYVLVYVNSTNRPPELEAFSYNVSQGAYALPNETLNFTLSFSDPERDPIQVIVDFGDNSTLLYLDLEEFGEGNISTVQFSHKYEKAGIYYINITYTDNKQGLFKHTKYVVAKVEVKTPPAIVVNHWDWWDSTSLSLFLGVIVLGIARLLYVERRRKRVEAQGMTYEEWRLLSQEMPEETDLRKEGGS